jgi:hypothetical protein
MERMIRLWGGSESIRGFSLRVLHVVIVAMRLVISIGLGVRRARVVPQRDVCVVVSAVVSDHQGVFRYRKLKRHSGVARIRIWIL